MKSTIIIIFNLFLILETVSGQRMNLKPYNVKSGIVEYSYSGNKVGKGTLYFDNCGTGLFLGKECKVLKGNMGKLLTWNGITMLLDMKITGASSHEEVTDIQINVPVAAKYFIIPKKIRFSEMPGL
ncbi:MAG TPA: hypothetical protein VMV77_06745 [Bacteroidales bacterium]|nr:hypothetical protein [Bacteroidales bacterium]